ncbi:hypothetical protein FJ656_06035 [Schumannella luteola]|nr:hypothetical protein FJ656_06035 [Schumannella luteola]
MAILAGCASAPTAGSPARDAVVPAASAAPSSPAPSSTASDGGACSEEMLAVMAQAGVEQYDGVLPAELPALEATCILRVAGTTVVGDGGSVPLDIPVLQAYYYGRPSAQVTAARDALIAGMLARGFQSEPAHVNEGGFVERAFALRGASDADSISVVLNWIDVLSPDDAAGLHLPSGSAYLQVVRIGAL